jgi:hypothetical protein
LIGNALNPYVSGSAVGGLDAIAKGKERYEEMKSDGRLTSAQAVYFAESLRLIDPLFHIKAAFWLASHYDSPILTEAIDQRELDQLKTFITDLDGGLDNWVVVKLLCENPKGDGCAVGATRKMPQDLSGWSTLDLPYRLEDSHFVPAMVIQCLEAM